MTIYNSQRVNSDPLPYQLPDGSRDRNPLQHEFKEGRIGSKRDFGAVYNPRPKYDNNPNPILEAFRTVSEHPRGGLVALAERVLKNRHGLWDEEINDPSYLEHAHLVLTKLINVYKETA